MKYHLIPFPDCYTCYIKALSFYSSVMSFYAKGAMTNSTLIIPPCQRRSMSNHLPYLENLPFRRAKTAVQCISAGSYWTQVQIRRRGGRGSKPSPAFQLGEQGEQKFPFLNEMICFPIITMIQRRSYKLKMKHYLIGKDNLYDCERHSP